MRAIPTFSDGKVTVIFERVGDVVGFTHRVRIVDVASRTLIGTDWLGRDWKPSAKNARYYADKHAAKLAV